MKNPLKLLLILSVLTIVNCKTIEYVEIVPEYEFDNPPVRSELEEPETVKDLANIIIYYENLVSEWESWGISVYDTLEYPLPESLIQENDNE